MSRNFTASLLIETATARKGIQDLTKDTLSLNTSLTALAGTLKATEGNLASTAKQMAQISREARTAASAMDTSAKSRIQASRLEATEISRVTAAEKARATAALAAQRTAAATANTSRANYYDGREARAAEAFAQAQRSAAASTDVLGNSLSNSRYLLYDVGATYRTLSLALLAIPAASTAVATSYEKDFAQVIRTTQGVQMTTQELRGELTKMASEIPLSFGELSNIAMIGGQMDIPRESLAKFTDTVAKFVATADGATIDSSTAAFGRMSNLFASGMNADDQAAYFQRLGAAISYTADNSVTSEAKIISMLDKMAPLASQAGLTTQNVVALSSALSSVGIAPELASGFMTRTFGGMNKVIAAGGDKLNAYSAALGMTADDVKRLRQEDPMALLNAMATKLAGMDVISQTTFLQKLGINATRDQRVIQSLAGGLDVLKKAQDDVNTAFGEGTYLDQSSAAIFDTFAANIKKMAGAFASLGDELGAGVLTYLGPMVKWVTDMASSFTELLKSNPGLKQLVGILMSVATAAGAFLAFKSALAFVQAGLIGFQHVAQSGIGKMGTLNGVVRQSAQTLLIQKGYTKEAAAAALQHKSATQALTTAVQANTSANATNNLSQAALGKSMLITNTRMSAVKGTLASVGSGLVGLAGGPVGAVMLAVTALGGAFLTSSMQATEAAKQITSAFQISADEGGKALSTYLNETKIGLGSFSEGAYVGNIGHSLREIADEAGIGFDRLNTAIQGGLEPTKALKAEIDGMYDKLRGENPFRDMNPQDITYDLATMSNVLKKQIEEMEKAEQTSKDLGDAGLKTAEGANAAANAMGEEGDAAESLASDLQKAVTQSFALIDASAAAAGSMDKLGESLQKSKSFDTGSDAGRTNIGNFESVLQNQALALKQALDAGEINSQQAADSYKAYVESVLSQLASMGVDTSTITGPAKDAIDAVRAEFLGASTDGSLTLQGAVEIDSYPALEKAGKTMDEIQTALNGNPVLAQMGITGDIDSIDKVNNVITYIQSVTGMPYEAIIDAITNPAGQKAQELGQYIGQIVRDPKYVAIDANTDAGVYNINSFASWAVGQLNAINSEVMSTAGAFGVGGAAVTALQYHASAPAQASAKAANADVAKWTGGANSLADAYKRAGKAADSAGKSGSGAGKKAGSGASKAAKAADKAGEAAKKAGEKALDAAQKALDKLKDWDAAYKAIAEYAGRVGNAFGYVKNSTRGVSEAMDAYYSAVNSAKDRVDGLKQSVKDLRGENKKLAAEMQTDKNDASKYDQLSKLAASYGDADRAKYYADEAKASKESAKEKQKQIDANKKEADSIEKGIGNLKGYSQAAIDNRAEVRKLEDAALDVAVAYANAGANAGKVKDATVKWTEKAKTHSRQLGYNKTDVDKVTSSTKALKEMLEKVAKPWEIKIAEKKVTTLQAKNETQSAVSAANKALDGAARPRTSTLKGNLDKGSVTKALNGIPKSREVRLNVKLSPEQKAAVAGVAGLGMGGVLFQYLKKFNAGGMVGSVPAFNGGGLIPGRAPSNPREDNMLAQVDGQGLVQVRSQEFIMRQEAVDYYGQSFMNKLNQMQLPRYYMGGMPGKSTSNSTNGGMVDLSAETIQAIARATAPEVALYVDSTEIARANAKGSKQLAQRGLTFG